MKPQQVRLVIAEGHPILRDSLRRLLESEAELKVIDEAWDGAETVKLARQLKPDILLLDLRICKQSDDLEALRELSNATPLRVILLAAYIENSQIVEALRLGARGVVLMASAVQVLLKAIQTVMAGEYWVHLEPVSNLEQSLRTLMQSMHEEVQQKSGLTPRELEILSKVVEGYSIKETADYFKIGEEDLNNIFDKLGFSKLPIKLAFRLDEMQRKLCKRRMKLTSERRQRMKPISHDMRRQADKVMALYATLGLIALGIWEILKHAYKVSVRASTRLTQLS